jgi:hypothetical protein
MERIVPNGKTTLFSLIMQALNLQCNAAEDPGKVDQGKPQWKQINNV